MNIKIGEIIKKLRKKQDITQEKLAEYLGISYQAVSKWENGTAMPDITLVPALAGFFGVSTDELFDMDSLVRDGKIKEYEAEYGRLATLGDVKGQIKLMRKALEEYPRNFQFMLFLAYALTSFTSTDEAEEAIKLCERILEDCTDDDIRHGAIQILCYKYPQDKAKQLAEKMPAMVLCREMLLAQILTGEEMVRQTQGNILQHIDWAANSIVLLAGNNNMGTSLSCEQKISFIEAANKLYEAVMPDDNYLFYNCRLAWNHHMLAKLWCSLGVKSRAMDSLEAAAKYADAFDNLQETAGYTSLIVNHCEHNKASTSKNWIGTERGMLYKRMSEPEFDCMRDMPEFKALYESLGR